MKRRDFLKGALAAQILAGQTILTSAVAALAEERTGLKLAELKCRLADDGSFVLFPSDAQFAAFQTSFNKRTLRVPQVRCLPATVEAVAIAVKWAQDFNVEFAVRGRGYSYEGYSQSNGLVIDLRLMSDLKFDAELRHVSVGGGAQLYDVYKYLSGFGMAIPAGTCPPVGVGGHSLGGGFGLIARQFGLACDSIVALEMVNASGETMTISKDENPDLFWALRGGGNGNFGIVTRFVFQAHPVGPVVSYGINWNLSVEQALVIAREWQRWAPQAPDEITSILRFAKSGDGRIRLHAAGLTLGSETDLRTELANLVELAKPDLYDVKRMSFMESVRHFGGSTAYESVRMKAKSDYVIEPMSDDGLRTLMQSLSASPSVITAIFDAYGGAFGRIGNGETAFVHREGTHYCIQYYTQWAGEAATATHLTSINDIYAAMRPYVSGQCYVNYCDLDLEDAPAAYWGANLPRLMQVKADVDPKNFFKHAQSIPLPT